MCLFFVFLLRAAESSQLPDGQKLIQGIDAAWKRHHSFQFIQEEVTMLNGSVTKETSREIIVNPGKRRSEPQEPAGYLTVSDGESTWILDRTENRYVKFSAALGFAARMAAMG